MPAKLIPRRGKTYAQKLNKSSKHKKEQMTERRAVSEEIVVVESDGSRISRGRLFHRTGA